MPLNRNCYFLFSSLMSIFLPARMKGPLKGWQFSLRPMYAQPPIPSQTQKFSYSFANCIITSRSEKKNLSKNQRIFKLTLGISQSNKLVFPPWKLQAFSKLILLLSHFSRVRLCDPIDGSPLGSSVPGILQARVLEWVAISFSNAWKWKVKVKLLSRLGLLATPWTAAYQAPPSMGFSRQEYWSGVPLPSPGLMCTHCCF